MFIAKIYWGDCLEYEIIRSKRKTIALQINEAGELVVRAPMKLSQRKIQKVVDEHYEWIEKHRILQLEKNKNRHIPTEQEIQAMKCAAKKLLPDLTRQYAEKMGVDCGTVKITSAQKRFGSCSVKNNICFSYILMQYPIEAIEYVVVHELAHTVHHNHSREFYALIENFMPDYREREKLLRQ